MKAETIEGICLIVIPLASIIGWWGWASFKSMKARKAMERRQRAY